MEFVDIAGLVAGASKGEGLGNQFLAHIRETQAIAHVVRCFEDDNVVHVAGRVDPLSDIETIQTELALADLDTVKRGLDRTARQAKGGDKDAVALQALLLRVQALLDQGRPARMLEAGPEERTRLRELSLLTAKPTLYIANVAEGELDGNAHVDRVRALAESEGAGVVVVCAAIEAELAGLDDAERSEYLAAIGQSEPGLDRVIRAGYALLDLQTFFTAGEKEARAWTLRKSSTAPQAAGVIHTDFERGFIRAEVIAYADYVAGGGEAGAREAGKWRLEGKDYIMQDGDVVHFRFNV